MWNLEPGAELIISDIAWQVQSCLPHLGRVTLVDEDGETWNVSVGELIHRADCRPSTRTRADLPAANRGRQPKSMDDLRPEQRTIVMLRVEHLREVETGFRNGHPLAALPHEPRPQYDPDTTTLTQRRLAKMDELRKTAAETPAQAKANGLHHVSMRTLIRWGTAHTRYGPIGVADDRWLREATGHKIAPELREALYAVYEESQHRSKLTMRDKDLLIRQYVHETFNSEESDDSDTPRVEIPGYDTLRSIWKDWFGSNGARQRYARSAAKTKAYATGRHIVVYRPGQVVALDSTVLPVKVLEHVFGDPVSVHLTLALDVYTRSIVAFRLSLVSDTSIDVAMVLRDMMMPLPMRPDWGEDMEWAYPGVPGMVVADFAGYEVAGLPFFAPETVTTDHGSVYRNHHLVEVQRVIKANIKPSRVLRPTDKHSVERTFGAIRSLLFALLLGYQGTDVADRGADPEADACLTVTEMEHLIATWVVETWQNRRFGSYAPSWDPRGDHSPNSLFAAAMSQGGFALRIPPAELYYQLLPRHKVMIHGKRGVKIKNLWYDGEALEPYRGALSHRGGRNKNKYVIHRDPRDPCFVFFQDPRTHDWHTLRWTGLPEEGEVPAFSDARVREAMRELRKRGLAPKADTELLPVLLELIGGNIPVEKWPTQLSKRQRTEHAREVAQASAAAADRPANSVKKEPPAQPASIPAARPGSPDAKVVPLRPTDRAQHVHDAVNSERRRRREAAVPDQLPTPPDLSERLRATSLLALPDDDFDDDDTTITASEAEEEADQ
ncbi:transposase [Streptomyces caniscabiei]|nr:transposase [Streptomyces caniscabiei]MBE4737573.1 transposase [Streptomyces caniscabiei]MBE4756333.1 transposase [Streptomyces caniscabiei]MBE4769650.1 transposase [Streptomyces caniscabiei]MBE4787404.1 transposase [Streptomyces caniscabiei]MBE4795191.1 transposase [Streptomyces caniscabiei]